MLVRHKGKLWQQDLIFYKMRLNRIFNTVNNKERGRGQRSVVGSSVGSLACITSMCSVQCFPGGHSLRSALGSFFYPHPSPPFILPLLNQCDGCLVPLAWGLMAGGRGFASHGGAALSRGWLCQGGSLWTSRAPTSTSDAVVKYWDMFLDFLFTVWLGNLKKGFDKLSLRTAVLHAHT